MEKAQADRVGTKVMACNGMEMTCIAYRRSDDIDVRFEDGTVIEHRLWESFIKGKIRNPNVKNTNAIHALDHYSGIRVGAKAQATNGMMMTCIAYRRANDIDVQFADKTIVLHKTWSNFRQGKISNPNVPYNRDSKSTAAGRKIQKKTWANFYKGNILNPDKPTRKRKA